MGIREVGKWQCREDCQWVGLTGCLVRAWHLWSGSGRGLGRGGAVHGVVHGVVHGWL